MVLTFQHVSIKHFLHHKKVEKDCSPDKNRTCIYCLGNNYSIPVRLASAGRARPNAVSRAGPSERCQPGGH